MEIIEIKILKEQKFTDFLNPKDDEYLVEGIIDLEWKDKDYQLEFSFTRDYKGEVESIDSVQKLPKGLKRIINKSGWLYDTISDCLFDLV